jgi:hypothetical protein
MKRNLSSFLVCAALAHPQAPIDRDILAKIRAEAADHSQVAPVFDMLTVTIGPRLTAPPAHKRAAEYVRDRLASYGLTNARLEPWHFGRGWTLEKLTVEMVEPRYLPLIGYADGWSSSTTGEIVGAPGRGRSGGSLRRRIVKKIALVFLAAAAASNPAEQVPDAKPPHPGMAPIGRYLIGDRSADIALVRSAAGIDDPDFWNPRIRAPICFTPPAALH